MTEQKEPAEKQANLKFLLRLLPYALHYKKILFIGAIGLFASAALSVLIPQGIRLMVDRGFASEGGDMLTVFGGLMLLLAVLFAVFMGIRVYYIESVGLRVVRDVRKQLFSKVVSQGIPYFDRHRVGDLISRLNSDVSTLGSFIGIGVSVALLDTISLLAILCIMFYMSWQLSSIIVIGIVVLFLGTKPFHEKISKASKEKQNALATNSVCVDDNISGIRTVKAFGQVSKAREIFATSTENVAQAEQRFTWYRSLFVAISNFAFYGILAMIIYAGGKLLTNEIITSGELAAFLIYTFLAIGSGSGLINFVSALNQTAGATKRLFEILDAPQEMPEPENPTPLPQTTGPRDISFEDVRFSYPTRPDQEVFGGVTVRIKKGETVAIVGPSGAGKTTFFSLLMRYYDPTYGRVCLDGVDVSALSHRDLCGALASVPQDASMFSASVYENILYGRPDATREEVIAAAKAAHAHAFIEGLADGYDTYVGEKGVQLSGGQKQRIAIARAFLCQPQVLLLDEATSNLDAQSEQAIKEALDEIRQGRTTLIIAHRLATVVHADRILVMENGQVVDQGNHTQLMESSELYASLVRLQMLKD